MFLTVNYKMYKPISTVRTQLLDEPLRQRVQNVLLYYYCKDIIHEPQIPFLAPVCAKQVKTIQHLSLSGVGMLQNHQIHKVLLEKFSWKLLILVSQSQKNNYLSSVVPHYRISESFCFYPIIKYCQHNINLSQFSSKSVPSTLFSIFEWFILCFSALKSLSHLWGPLFCVSYDLMKIQLTPIKTSWQGRIK